MKPVDNLIRLPKYQPCRQRGPGDHDDGQLQLSCSDQLGTCTFTPCILAQDDLCPVGLQQGEVALSDEGAARDHHLGLGQRLNFRRINQPQQVVMLRQVLKQPKMLAPDGKENSLCRPLQQVMGCGQGRDLLPDIARFRLPGRALQPAQRELQLQTGRGGIVADLGRKRMGRIDHLPDPICLHPGDQPGDATEAALAHRQRLSLRGVNPPSIRENRRKAFLGKLTRQCAGLSSAAKQEGGLHG